MTAPAAPRIVDLRGKLPRRQIVMGEPGTTYTVPQGTVLVMETVFNGHLEYVNRPLSAVEVLAIHYAGDPVPDGSVDGYGEMTAERVAKYQVEKTTGDLYPEVAYPFILHLDGTIDVCLGDPADPDLIGSALKVQSWHVGEQNPRCVGVLLTGVGKLGRPNEAQQKSIMWLWLQTTYDLSELSGRPRSDRIWRFVLKGHQELQPPGATQCPGPEVMAWLKEVRDD